MSLRSEIQALTSFSHHFAGPCVAGFGIFAANTTFFWTVCVALHICLVSHGMLPTLRDKFFFGYHVAGWGIPACISFFTMQSIPSSMVGKSDQRWCYIDDPVGTDGQTHTGASMPWRVGTVYGPMWLCWILSLVLYMVSMVALSRLYAQQREMATEEPGGKALAQAHSLRSQSSTLTGSLKRPASLATEVWIQSSPRLLEAAPMAVYVMPWVHGGVVGRCGCST